MKLDLKLKKIDIIVTNAEKMALFYENVFNIKMQQFDVNGYKFYNANLSDLFKIQFVPKDFVNVDLKRNRQQLNFEVSDLNHVITNALKFDGTQIGEIENNDNMRIFSVKDPDGNYMVFQGN